MQPIFILLSVLLVASAPPARGQEVQSVIKLIRESETALAGSNIEQARALAETATHQDPAHAPSWYQLGVVELRARQFEPAIKAFRESLTIDPSQSNIWKSLALAEWNAGKSDEAIKSIRQHIGIQPGDTTAQHDLAGWLVAVGQGNEAAEILRTLAAVRRDDASLWKELGSIYFREGNYEAAREAFEKSLNIKSDDPAVHRDLAWCYWNLHEKSAARPLLEKALASTLKYLESDSGNVPMNVMAGRMMSALDLKDQARAHYTALLARNTNFVSALAYLREDATTRRAFADAVDFARRRANVEPSNIGAMLDLANSLAQNDQFPDALHMLRSMAAKPVTAGIPILAYQTLNEFDSAGRNTLKQIISHIEVLHIRGYQIVNKLTFASTNTSKAVLILQDAHESDLGVIDEKLATVNGKAIYAGGFASVSARRAGKPSKDFLRKLEQTGRWLIIPSTARTERKPVNESGVLGNLFTNALYVNQTREEETDKATRVTDSLMAMKSDEFMNPENVFVYPFGDYGQKSLDSTGEDMAALASAAGKAFKRGLYFSDQGFCLPENDPMRMPALEVSPVLSAEMLAAHLTKDNPLVVARLELAKVLYWHRQYEVANYWFAGAEKAGADPFAVNFSWGACADNQGDIPTAMEKLAKAREIDPDDERLIDLLKRAEDRNNTKAAFNLRSWDDNEGRSYYQWGLDGSLQLTESWRVGLLANRNHWELDGAGGESGTRVGATIHTFVAPQIWVDASLWHLAMDDVDDLTGGDALVHLPFRWSSGFFELSASRDEIETVEALREGLYADTYRIHNYSRLVDRFDLFATFSEVSRSDENHTQMLEGRLLYRIKEWPYIGFGYHGRMADSDEDPPEYWAPEQLEQHQAHLNLRRTYGASRLSLSADAGYAREQDTDWKFVWGANGNIETIISRTLSLRLQLQYYESPTYHRTSGSVGIGVEF